MRLLSALLLMSVCTGGAVAAAETRAVNLMGITLGKPLNLPLCGQGPVGASCKSGPTRGDQWEVTVSRSLKPPYVRSFKVRVLDGVVEEMQIATATGSPQSDVIEDLKLKFGKSDTAEMLPDGFRESWAVAGGGQIVHDTETGQISVITPKSWAWKPAKPLPKRPHL